MMVTSSLTVKAFKFCFQDGYSKENYLQSLIYSLLCNETFWWPRISPLHTLPATVSLLRLFMMSLPISITVEGGFYQSQQSCIIQGKYELFIPPAYSKHVLARVCGTHKSSCHSRSRIFGLCLLLCGAVLIKSQYEKWDLVFQDRSGGTKVFPGSPASNWANHLVPACAVYVIWLLHLSFPLALQLSYQCYEVSWVMFGQLIRMLLLASNL